MVTGIECFPTELRIIIVEYVIEPIKQENDRCLNIFLRYDGIVFREGLSKIFKVSKVLEISSQDKQWKQEIDQAVHLFRDVMITRPRAKDLETADHADALDLWAIHPSHPHPLLKLRANICRFATNLLSRMGLGELLGVWEKAMEQYQIKYMKRRIPLAETELRRALEQGTAGRLKSAGMASTRDLREISQFDSGLVDTSADVTLEFPQSAHELSARFLELKLRVSVFTHRPIDKFHCVEEPHYQDISSAVRYSKEVPAASKRLEEQRSHSIRYEGFGSSS